MIAAGRVIALITDFGQRDIYAGVMRTVIAGIAPEARVIDLTHRIPAQAIGAGAYALAAAAPYLPLGSIVVCVIDPGVGTQRRSVIVSGSRCTVIGPDNGVLGIWMRRETLTGAWAIDPGLFPNASRTFHGRDIFAPVAARLATGASASTFGAVAPMNSLVSLPEYEPVIEDGVLRVQVLDVDRFGNVITNADEETIRTVYTSRCRGFIVRGLAVALRETYGDVQEGELLAYFGSGGFLELGVRNGSAAQQLKLTRGEELVIGLEKN